MYKRLHDTLPESLKLGEVTDFAFRLFMNLLAKADWFGRMHADPEKIMAICFGNRKGKVSDHEVQSALDELAEVRGEGLLHLYIDEEGERWLVIHKHEKSNPTGGFKTKPVKGPPPPRGLCTCIRYKTDEEGKRFGGKEFRFFPTIFPQSFHNRQGGLISRDLSEVATDQYTASSPLLSSPKGGGPGEGDVQTGTVAGFQDRPEKPEAKEAPDETPGDPADRRPKDAAHPSPEEVLEVLKLFPFPGDKSKLLAVEDLERQGVPLACILETLRKNRKKDFLKIVDALRATVPKTPVLVVRPADSGRKAQGSPRVPQADSRRDPEAHAAVVDQVRKKKEGLPAEELEVFRKMALEDPAAAGLKGPFAERFVQSKILSLVADRFGIQGL